MKWWLLLLCACAPSAKHFEFTQGDGGSNGGDAGQHVVDAGPTCGCTRWSTPQTAGLIPSELDELSGLVASRSQPGIFYTHNDSGDSARFFAISNAGALMETFTLTGATATDWEDLALGPCDAGTCVYLGDIGDNGLVRTNYAVYRVAEPHVSSGTTPVSWERLPYEYPNGAKHNAESLFMHPTTGELYLVTKEPTGHSSVYKFPTLDPATTVTLQFVAELSVPDTSDSQLTGADVNVCGTAVLLRMYNRLVELRLPADATSFDQIFQVTPVEVPVAAEDQGEAVAYSADGSGYFTSSESPVSMAKLSSYTCRN